MVRKPILQTELRELALQTVKGKWICPISVINFSFPATNARGLVSQKWIEDYGRPGWKTSPLVDFGFSAAASDVLHCGRMLRI